MKKQRCNPIKFFFGMSFTAFFMLALFQQVSTDASSQKLLSYTNVDKPSQNQGFAHQPQKNKLKEKCLTVQVHIVSCYMDSIKIYSRRAQYQ